MRRTQDDTSKDMEKCMLLCYFMLAMHISNLECKVPQIPLLAELALSENWYVFQPNNLPLHPVQYLHTFYTQERLWKLSFLFYGSAFSAMTLTTGL